MPAGGGTCRHFAGERQGNKTVLFHFQISAVAYGNRWLMVLKYSATSKHLAASTSSSRCSCFQYEPADRSACKSNCPAGYRELQPVDSHQRYRRIFLLHQRIAGSFLYSYNTCSGLNSDPGIPEFFVLHHLQTDFDSYNKDC